MKTTLEIFEDLMHAVKVRATATGRKLKDVVAELIRRGLETPPQPSVEDPVQAWAKKLVFHPDGTVTNPDGIDDAAFFEAAVAQFVARQHRGKQIPRALNCDAQAERPAIGTRSSRQPPCMV